MDKVKKRILTGFTPTGKLHLGHYVGNLENLLKLQSEYQTFLLLADTHALTTLSQKADIVRQHTLDVLLDLLAVGLSEDNVVYHVESEIPEIYELASLFSMYVSHNRALRNPTIKDEITMKGLGDQFSLGFVNYPMFQAADILCVRGDLVPVGIDQEAHLEQSREVARVFNSLAKKQGYNDIFPEPQALIGRVGKLIGTDGNPKMSKSLGNTIYLSSTPEEVKEKVMSMYTDPNRIHATDPGKVEGNPLFIYLDSFGKKEHEAQIAEYKERYIKGTVGDVEVKKYLITVLEAFLAPIRERRKQYHDEKKLLEILHSGTTKTKEEAQAVLKSVKQALHFVY
ncbi:MAG: tryptophan--tRNA ligase [Patescibacteria group bacterium]